MLKRGAAWVYAWLMIGRRLAFLFLGVGLLLALGCATSQGSLYRKTTEAEEQQAESRRQTLPPPRSEEPVAIGLQIDSEPDGASVYLNDRYMGLTPLLLDTLSPGGYQVRLELAGYYPRTSWVVYSGGPMVFRTDLRRITGFLEVEVQPPGAEIRIGDATLRAGTVAELPVGPHTARVHLFGYEDYSATVQIAEKAVTRLTIVLSPAAFRLENLRASRSRFNPHNPGLLGSTRIRFRVTSYGAGHAAVLDADSAEVWQKTLPRFTTWEQAFDWNGRSSEGDLLQEGLYRLVIEAAPEEGGEPQRAEIPVTIDASVRLSYRPLWDGASGLLFVPSPETLPKGGVQVSSLVMSHAATDSFRTPWDIGLRYGLGAGRGLELDVHGGVILGYGETVPYFVSAAAKLSLGRGAIQSAALCKLAWQSVRTDPFANFSGLTFGLPASASLGPLTFFLAPELTLSLWDVSYTDTAWPEPSFNAWAYAKAGLALDLNPWTLGLSLAARTLPFNQGLGVALPVEAGLELHWMIPGTQLFLSTALTGELSAFDSWYLSAGLGLGLLD
jgi:hypothetical protein